MMRSLLALLITVSITAHGLGINCRGSSGCNGEKSALGQLSNLVQGIQESRHYNNGEHIACVGRGRGLISLINPNDAYCLFLQGTPNGLDGASIRRLVAQLQNHGCRGCGSVPINFPESNDPNGGILTANYVSSDANPCPDKLC